MTLEQQIAVEAQRLVNLARRTRLTYSHGPTTSIEIFETQVREERPLDDESTALKGLLILAGHVPHAASPVVEWGGVKEFGNVPMFWFDDVDDLDSPLHWIAVNTDGTIERF